MRKIIIFGNSGSGKSTLAKRICDQSRLAHLDLDVLAWQDTAIPTRKPLVESEVAIEKFLNSHSAWVVEGCYSDLLGTVMPFASKIIFLNLSTSQCIANAKARPWEPHKYESKEAQDANLSMLIDWISQYSAREDMFSEKAHQKLFDDFSGDKEMITENVSL